MVRCAVHGTVTWLTFAVVEYLFATLFPLLASPTRILGDWHTGASLQLAIIYCMAGALTGALVGLVRPTGHAGSDVDSAARIQAWCTWVLMVAVLVAMAGSGRGWYRSSAFVYQGLLTAGLFASLSSERWPGALRALGNPWSASLLMMAPAWVGREWLTGSPGRGPAALATALAIVLWSMRRAATPVRPRRAIALALCVGALVASSAVLISGNRQDRLAPAAAVRRPFSGPAPINVVLIVLDTVRADRLSVYGYPRRTAPSLEALARESVLWRHAVAPSDVTLSSHASLFTGLYASEHDAHTGEGAPFLGRRLADSIPTMAARLASAGYWTSAVVANYGYLGPEMGLMRGFDYVNSPAPQHLSSRIAPLRHRLRLAISRWYNLRDFDRQSRPAAEINRDAFRVLCAARRAGTPFFLFLNYMDAHAPYIPPPPYHRRFAGYDPAWTHDDFNRMVDEVAGLKRVITSRERAHIDSQYDASLAYLDHHLGRLFRRLKALDLYDQTMIVVTADHGEALGDRNLMEHGGVSVYQDQVHVPLLIKYPGSRRRGGVGSTVSLVDVFPTVMDLLDLPEPPGLNGRSLDAPPVDRLIVAESFPHGQWQSIHQRFRRMQRAGYWGASKLILSSTGKRELYRWRRDPGERHDLAASAASAAGARAIESHLRLWVALARGPAPERALSRDSVERLRSLGYTQ
jgi:arylsulfatase A-like enzyme